MSNLDSIFDDVIEVDSIKPPIAVLNELVQLLEKKTSGMLIGNVEQTVYDSSSLFRLTFYIIAPSLNNYSYEVFEVKHNLDFYPLEMKQPGLGFSKVGNQAELEVKLRTIISSPQVKKVINGLLAQIKSTN